MLSFLRAIQVPPFLSGSLTVNSILSFLPQGGLIIQRLNRTASPMPHLINDVTWNYQSLLSTITRSYFPIW